VHWFVAFVPLYWISCTASIPLLDRSFPFRCFWTTTAALFNLNPQELGGAINCHLAKGEPASMPVL
jgi:hypothetical protein